MSWLVGVAFAVGCNNEPKAARYPGVVVSHVDRYGSGTGGEANLLASDQSMGSGFNYGLPDKADWTSSIKWRLVGQRGDSDVYEFKWEFLPASGNKTVKNRNIEKTRNIEYNGRTSIIVFENAQQVVSVEPRAFKAKPVESPTTTQAR
jgi:hypothetical protein